MKMIMANSDDDDIQESFLLVDDDARRSVDDDDEGSYCCSCSSDAAAVDIEMANIKTAKTTTRQPQHHTSTTAVQANNNEASSSSSSSSRAARRRATIARKARICCALLLDVDDDDDGTTTATSCCDYSSTTFGVGGLSFSCLPEKTHSRTIVLRSLLIISLLTTVMICTYLSYTILKSSEKEIGIQNFESIASSALIGAQSITIRKFQGSEVMSTLFSYIHPNLNDWPLKIDFDGYVPVSESIAKLGSSTSQSLMVLLDPKQVSISEFEQHTKESYKKQGRPSSAGYNDFGFGIWNPDPHRPYHCQYDDCRVHSTSSTSTTTTTETTEWGGKLSIQTPLMFHNEAGAKSLLFNVYAQEDRGIHIDAMNDCVVKSKLEEHDVLRTSTTAGTTEEEEVVGGDTSTSSPNSTTTYPSCAVVTDFLQLAIREGPAALIFHPIFPANDPNKFVGFATTSIHWEEALTSVVPNYVNGLICVVSTPTTSHTYKIEGGQPVYMGEGDLHDHKYSHLQRNIELTQDLVTGASSAATYTLTVYPTDEMFEIFQTNNPIMVSIGFFGVVAFCTYVFFLYDYLMRHEVQQRRSILEMKRRFVRFISHEIRTPLNTVFLGLELLQRELMMAAAAATTANSSTTRSDDGAMLCAAVAETTVLDSEDIGFWSNVANDIKENAYTAVEILNDMLNYDKLENGDGLNLELSQVRIADVMVRTVRQFQIQAVNRNINLSLHIDGETPGDDLEASSRSSGSSSGESSSAWTVIGDDVRLGQVMRNLISNALKFTPKDGKVEVSAYYIPDGLPDAKSLCLAKDESGECAFIQNRAGSVRIIVKDTGIGLSKKQLSKLFGEGVQFDANKLQHGGGSGLGLNIAKGIVEQHSGTIIADSEGHGNGTSFIMELPLYKYHDFGSGRYRDDRTDPTASLTEFKGDDLTAPFASFKSVSERTFKSISERSKGDDLLVPAGPPLPPSPPDSSSASPDKARGIDRKVSFSSMADAESSIEIRTSPSSTSTISDCSSDEQNIQPARPLLKTKSSSLSTVDTKVDPTENERFRQRRVLVVEDVVSSLKMLMRILKRAGHTCEGAENGKVAIEKMEADLQVARDNPDTHIPFDTILMDYEMPLVNGPTASARIRQMGFNGNIVGVTGNVLQEDVQFFKDSGANEVLAKPVSMARIDGYWAKEEAIADIT